MTLSTNPPPPVVPPNPVALAAAAAQSEARRGGYGPDSGDVQALARAAMSLSPRGAARVGAWLLRAALQREPSALDQEDVARDLDFVGRLILSFDPSLLIPERGDAS